METEFRTKDLASMLIIEWDNDVGNGEREWKRGEES